MASMRERWGPAFARMAHCTANLHVSERRVAQCGACVSVLECLETLRLADDLRQVVVFHGGLEELALVVQDACKARLQRKEMVSGSTVDTRAP